MKGTIPEGFTSLTPTLVFKDTRKAINFYKEAFGAKECYCMPGPNGQGVMHAEVMIGNSIVMMNDEFPQQQVKSAESLGVSPVNFYLYVDDVDASFARALAAGGEQEMAVQDMFWGDRAGSFKDPFGYNWMLATHVKNLTPEEMADAASKFFESNKCP
ncbi:VOC family protein [Geomonas sp. Red32]|uniref:VOC family protein n=1 Tax=Geomonas sp. Red32 TaxID=2912856 RepID=UPI00202CB748|nr:VOC family protein [Geomonas sp. Red32]MCM0082584.1 VOC family protein [Geomonas sp. Red32]